MPGDDVPVYAIYGARLGTEHRFENALPRAQGAPDVRFASTLDAPPESAAFETSDPAAALGRLADGRPFQTVHRRVDCDLIRYTDVADFYVLEREIVCWLREPEYAWVVEIYLLGFVLSYWLERFRGTPALHAAAVVVHGRAVAFLATNKGGKTSLAATMMAAGHPLLTDDILAIEERRDGFLGLPGYPQMRMWPDQAEHFLSRSDHLELVHRDLAKRRIPVGKRGLGQFCSTPTPIGCFYLPDRRDPADGTDIEITPVPRAEAVMELIGNSFVARVLDAIGGQGERLKRLGSLVAKVPVRRLTYPSGMEYLPAVDEAVAAEAGWAEARGESVGG